MATEIFKTEEEALQKYPKIPNGKAYDYADKTFGRLTGICRVNKTGAGRAAQWLFKCNCNNYIVTTGSYVKNGHTNSCGCYNREITASLCREVGKKQNFIDYTKINNPYYTFIEPTDRIENHMKVWKIQCKKCGKIYEDAPSQVVSNTRIQGNNPCACWKHCSKGNLKIAALLEENGLPYQAEYQFSDCLSPKGNPFKFDFYVNNQYLIEYDGEQHYKPVAFHGDQDKATEQFLLNQQYDELKNQYCKQHNIPLIRIPYTLYAQLTINDLMINTSAYIL